MLPITSLLAVFIAALFQVLAIRTVRRRHSQKIAVGTGNDDTMARLMRAQGNLLEYGILMLALTALAELNGAPRWWLALLAAAFAIGRIAHAYSLIVAEPLRQDYSWRVRGMALTLFLLPFMAVTLLVCLIV